MTPTCTLYEPLLSFLFSSCFWRHGNGLVTSSNCLILSSEYHSMSPIIFARSRQSQALYKPSTTNIIFLYHLSQSYEMVV
ncbi:hypothetical protein F4604DRAFT_1699270 [Suillus subluteus]|nr:hypothetical protein F4604DRAFT_1699270 [Suillus subluteus]